MTKSPKAIQITKMQGCGNDFVFVDNRQLALPVENMETWAKAVCKRAFGVGADGLVFLEEAPDNPSIDYRWHFYNADGSRAEMCGNASRCVAVLAPKLGFAGPEHVFGSDAGPIRAKANIAENTAKVALPPATDLALNMPIHIQGKNDTIHFVNTGVPHAIYLHSDAASLDVKELGSYVRYHELFAPSGTNANFVTVLDQNNIHLRTYERGVEDETFACGTGAAAGVVVTHALGLTGPNVTVRTSGNEKLGISLEGENLFLSGKALTIYSGEMYLEPLGLSLP